MGLLHLVVSALLFCAATVRASTIVLIPGVPVVFTLYFNNDDSGTNAGPGTSRISLVGAGGTPEGTTRRRALLSQASAARGEELMEAAGAHGRSLLQPRSAFTANLIFNHDLFNCAVESNCAVTSSSATSNVYSCDQQITTFCSTVFAIAQNGTAPGATTVVGRRRQLLQTNLEKYLKMFVACKRAIAKDRVNCVFELPSTKTNYNLLTLFQAPIAPTTFVDCEISLGNAVAHCGACFVPYNGPTRFNLHFDGPSDVLPPIQFSVQLNQNPPMDTTSPDYNADQYAFFLNTNPTLLVDKTGIIPVSGNSN